MFSFYQTLIKNKISQKKKTKSRQKFTFFLLPLSWTKTNCCVQLFLFGRHDSALETYQKKAINMAEKCFKGTVKSCKKKAQEAVAKIGFRQRFGNE